MSDRENLGIGLVVPAADSFAGDFSVVYSVEQHKSTLEMTICLRVVYMAAGACAGESRAECGSVSVLQVRQVPIL